MELKTIKIVDIALSKDNPRKKFDGVKFDELVSSIKAFGLTVPVIVRKAGAKYELLAGARRLAAVKKLGHKEIDANISEADAFNVTYSENTGRADLTLQEQSAAIKTLLEKHADAKKVAELLGIPESQVRASIHVEKNLSTELFQEIPSLAHAAALAKYPRDIQESAWQQMRYGNDRSLKTLVLRLKALNRTISASACPWSAECKDCQKRSDARNQIALWADTGKKAPEICLDSDCFDIKQNAFVGKAIAEMPKKYVVGRNPDVDYNLMKGVKVVYDFEYKSAKEGAKDSVRALCLEPGKNYLKYLYFALKDKKQAKQEKTIESENAPKADAKALLAGKRAIFIIKEVLAAAIARKIDYDKFMAAYGFSGLCRLAADVGTIYNKPKAEPEAWRAAAKVDVGSNPMEDLLAQIQGVLCLRLKWSGPISQVPPEMLEEAKIIAPLVGLMVDDLEARAAISYPIKGEK